MGYHRIEIYHSRQFHFWRFLIFAKVGLLNVVGMEEAHPDWKSVPVEILHKTFILVETETLREISFVCKAWTHAAQAALYQTVSLRSLLQLKSFYDTVEHRPNLGKNVKKFSIPFRPEEVQLKRLVTTLLTTYLPNVEFFYEPYKSEYLHTMNALLDSQLTRLKSLREPFQTSGLCEIANYTTCALLMKDRLSELHVSDRYWSMTDANIGESYLGRLYDKLHQFNKLEILHIDRKTNKEVEMLEYIVESCKTLRELNFNFASYNNLARSQVYGASYATLIPRSNVKTINGYINALSISTVIPYIIRKFLQLQKIVMKVRTDIPIYTDEDTINSLYEFLANVKEFSINGLGANPDTAWDIVGNRWVAASAPGSEGVTFAHNGTRSTVQMCSISLRRENGLTNTCFAVKYPRWNRNWINLEFVKKYGEYLQMILIEYSVGDELGTIDELRELPDNFVEQVITHCPNLNTLSFEGFNLRPFPYFKMDSCKEFSLCKFSLLSCAVYPGALEQLSLSITHIQHFYLSIWQNHSRNVEVGFTGLDFPIENSIEIIMPYTSIDMITIEQHEEEPIYVKLYSFEEKSSCFYYCDLMIEGNDHLKEITEEEYFSRNHCRHINIFSDTIPELYITDQ